VHGLAGRGVHGQAFHLITLEDIETAIAAKRTPGVTMGLRRDAAEG
jgi:hypothetical protein